jgi:hypothetical protein
MGFTIPDRQKEKGIESTCTWIGNMGAPHISQVRCLSIDKDYQSRSRIDLWIDLIAEALELRMDSDLFFPGLEKKS